MRFSCSGGARVAGSSHNSHEVAAAEEALSDDDGSVMASQFGVTLKQLRELMEHRGAEGADKIKELGGVHELCKKLRTTEKTGETSLTTLFTYTFCVHGYRVGKSLHISLTQA